MRALRYTGNGRVTVGDVPDPRPAGPGEALIQIEASAVCGSERRALFEGMEGNNGHEACGRVLDAGDSAFGVGERVGLSAIIGCGRCDRCESGEELHCRNGAVSSARSGGWHAELAVVSTAALRRLPDSVGAVEGVLLSGDSLGVPARAMRLAGSAPGDLVLVIGLGPVGLGHVLVRTFAGAAVIAIEPSAYRRTLGEKLGAIATASPGAELSGRPKLVLECSGRVASINYALEAVEGGGIVVQSAECHVPLQVNPSETFVRHEVTYTGSWYYSTRDYAAMCDLFRQGIALTSMCTHEVRPEDAQEAIAAFLGGESGKVVVTWS